MSAKGGPGRPRDFRVGDALLSAALFELCEKGFDRSTIAGIAARARTSKQAIYRRHSDKTALIAASLEAALLAARPSPPLRGNVAADLRRTLSDLASAMQADPLRGALRALLSCRPDPVLAGILEDAETAHRLVLRQILIATPFEAEMETRIDLLLGHLHYRIVMQDQRVTVEDIAKAVELVLGLIAPRDPRANSGFPGL